MSKSLLPSEKIETIIFKLLSTHPKYINLLLEYVKKEWFESKKVGEILHYIRLYYVKYYKLPSEKTLDLIIDKLYATNEADMNEVKALKERAKEIDANEFDLEFLDGEIITYLKSTAYYNTVMSNIEDIEQKHNCTSCCEELTKISSMTLEYDLGLDYIVDIDGLLERLANPANRLSTGFDSIDEVTNGGLLRDGKCLAIIQAATHVGKSLVLTNLATNFIQQDLFVLIITLEMSEDVYGQRISANLTNCGVNLLGLEKERSMVKYDVENIRKNCPNSKLLIKEFAPQSLSCNNLKVFIDKATMTYNRKPDVILIDYLTLMIPNGKEFAIALKSINMLLKN